MHQGLPTLALLLAGTVLLTAAALHDLCFRTVPNCIPLALFGCGVVLRAINHQIEWGLGAFGIVFLATYAMWRMGWMGGGDVKLLAAAAIFVPPPLVVTMILATSLAGGVLALLYLIVGRLTPKPADAKPASLLLRAARCEQWRLRRRGPLPYATAIATGGVLVTLAFTPLAF